MEDYTGCCSANALRTSTIIVGSFGFLLWPTVVGFTLNYGFYSFGYYNYSVAIMFAALVLIGANIGYIYTTSLIIFRLTRRRSLTPADVDNIRTNTARLVAFIMVGFAEWVTSVVWFSMYQYWDTWFTYATLFGCSFSFLWSVVVAAVAGSFTMQYRSSAPRHRDEILPLVQGPPRLPEARTRSSIAPTFYDPEDRRQATLKSVRSEIASPHGRGSPEYKMKGTSRSTRSDGAPLHGRVSPWANDL